MSAFPSAHEIAHALGGKSIGPALGEAACHAEEALRALVRMTLRLDAADLAVTGEAADIIEAVADLSSGLTRLADQYSQAEAARRSAAA